MPKCGSCGTELPEGTTVCSKCGAPLAPPPPPPPEGPISRERRERYEKMEKEKGEKREKGEKGEKGEADRFGQIAGGVILILLGGLFYLTEIKVISWSDFGGYFLLGIGAILIVWALIRYMTLAFKGPALGLLIGGLLVSVLGLSSLIQIRESGALILIAFGVIIIVASLAALRSRPRQR